MRLGALWRRHSSVGEEIVVARVWRAERALDRMRGLLGRPPLKPGEGLLIDPCGSVHTFGMRYPLDIVFVDEGIVTRVVRNLAPRRMAFAFDADSTLEMAPGEIDRLRFAVGDAITWKITA